MKLLYQIHLHSTNILAVTISSPEPASIRLVYKGMKLLTIHDGNAFVRDEEGVLFLHSDTPLYFQYLCEVGFSGKHGFQGYCGEKWGAFELGKVLMQPMSLQGECYHCQFDFHMPRPLLTPLPEQIVTSVDQIIQTAKFSLIYGDFVQLSPQIYAAFPLDIVSEVASLLHFYEGLLNVDLSDLLILLADKDTHLFGGAGKNAISAAFDPDSLRDWELLSHRIFHAAIARTTFSFPMYLEEGLASYFELKSMQSLARIPFSLEDALRELYRRYLLFHQAFGYRLVPDHELDYLRFPHFIEFLHYTQAPLVIAELDQKGCLDFSNLDSPWFHSDKMLQLEFLCGDKPEKPELVLQQLNDFCYLLYTWERMRDPSVQRRVLSPVTPKRPPKNETEKWINRFSPTVFSQILEHSSDR